MTLRRQEIKDKIEAMSWTEYVITHLLKAKLQPEKTIAVLVPDEKTKQFFDKAISELCEQSYEAWQLETKIATKH